MLPLRLRRVGGHDGRANDVLFMPPAAPPPPPPAHPPAVHAPRALVFFGGDVQDYPEVMQAHRDNRNYVKWNLQSMARLLARDFPTHYILVVRPARIEYKSFSCYDNFVPSNSAGVPDHAPTHNALHHLERLLQSVSSRVKALPTPDLLEAVSSVSLPEEIDIEELHNASIRRLDPTANGAGAEAGADMGAEAGAGTGAEAEADGAASSDTPDVEPLWWRDSLALDECSLTLVGFSKGCVVLNQLIYEFHYAKTLTPGDAHIMRFMARIESMYWLDGGHAGGKNTWITSRSLLETLTRLGVNIFVHVSPYQVQDEGRPWIGREEKAFTGLLNKLGAKVRRYLHEGGGAPQSLHMHFNVLANFKSTQDSAPHSLPDASDDEQ